MFKALLALAFIPNTSFANLCDPYRLAFEGSSALLLNATYNEIAERLVFFGRKKFRAQQPSLAISLADMRIEKCRAVSGGRELEAEAIFHIRITIVDADDEYYAGDIIANINLLQTPGRDLAASAGLEATQIWGDCYASDESVSPVHIIYETYGGKLEVSPETYANSKVARQRIKELRREGVCP